MPDRVILDSSIIAAIFLQDDDDSLRARKMIRNYDRITLDTAIADIGNVAWKKTVLFGEDSSEMLSGLEDGVNGGGAPRCKQAGHARRRRMKLILNRSDQFLSRTRMPFIPDASIGVLR